MKTLLSSLATVVLSCALIGPAVAQQRSPKDTPSPPRGVEGPEMRNEAPRSTRGADTPKTEKKGPRAKSQQPRHTDSPPKAHAEPDIKQDGGKKTQ
jgi:hypothetical protein